MTVRPSTTQPVTATGNKRGAAARLLAAVPTALTATALITNTIAPATSVTAQGTPPGAPTLTASSRPLTGLVKQDPLNPPGGGDGPGGRYPCDDNGNGNCGPDHSGYHPPPRVKRH